MAIKVARWSLGSLVFLAVVAVAFVLLQPQPSDALCIPGPCPSGRPFQTPTVTGTGASCSEARTNATAKAASHAAARCGRGILVCNFQFVENFCGYGYHDGVFRVQGYAKHNCRACQGF